jgi:hypothetical protein
MISVEKLDLVGTVIAIKHLRAVTLLFSTFTKQSTWTDCTEFWAKWTKRRILRVFRL